MCTIGKGVKEEIGEARCAQDAAAFGALGAKMRRSGATPLCAAAWRSRWLTSSPPASSQRTLPGVAERIVHPARKALCGDFLHAVEAGVRRKRPPAVRPPPGSAARQSLACGRWAGAGNSQHFFGIIDFVLGRDDALVRDHVLMERTAHGAGIAAEIDDDRRRPIGEDLRSRMLGVAVDIDENVDVVSGDLRGRLGVARARRCRASNRRHFLSASALRRSEPARRNNKRRFRRCSCRAVPALR